MSEQPTKETEFKNSENNVYFGEGPAVYLPEVVKRNGTLQPDGSMYVDVDRLASDPGFMEENPIVELTDSESIRRYGSTHARSQELFLGELSAQLDQAQVEASFNLLEDLGSMMPTEPIKKSISEVTETLKSQVEPTYFNAKATQKLLNILNERVPDKDVEWRKKLETQVNPTIKSPDGQDLTLEQFKAQVDKRLNDMLK